MGAGSMASGALGRAASGAAGGAAAGAFGGPVGIAVGAGIGALGSIFGAKANKSASNTASRYEYDATMKALEDAKAEREYNRARDDEQRTYERGQVEEGKTYNRGQYADYLGRLSPYADAGSGAVRSFAARMPDARALAPTNGSMAGGVVQMRAPNGQVKAVPAHLVARAEAKGAVRV